MLNHRGDSDSSDGGGDPAPVQFVVFPVFFSQKLEETFFRPFTRIFSETINFISLTSRIEEHKGRVQTELIYIILI